MAEAVRQACIDAALRAYEDAGLSGLCHEGRWEYAVDAMRGVDLPPAGTGADQWCMPSRQPGARTDDWLMHPCKWGADGDRHDSSRGTPHTTGLP